MKLNLIAPLLLSVFAGSAFAHSYHDDEAPQPPLKQEAAKDAKASVDNPKHKDTRAPADAQDKAKTAAPADPAAAEPKKTP